MLALTGIREESLRRLEKRGETLLEVISFANVRTASLLTPGEQVFLTSEPYEMLGNRTDGIVAEVVSVDIGPVRTNIEYIDEKEIQRARIRVKFHSYGRIKSIMWLNEQPNVELIILENALIL